MIRLRQVKGAFVRGCRASAGTGTFLRLEGDATDRVLLLGNDLSQAKKAVETDPDLPKNVLLQMANLTIPSGD